MAGDCSLSQVALPSVCKVFPCPFCSVQIQGESGGTAKASSAQVMKYRGVFGTIATMVRTEGPRSLYNGLVAGLQRQMSFASVRIGLYDSVKQFYTKGSDRKYMSFGVVLFLWLYIC